MSTLLDLIKRITRGRRREDRGATPAPTAAPARKPAEKQVPTKHADPDVGTVLDLRALESTRMRVKGTSYYVPDSQRHRAGSRTYRLVREPENPHDDMAIAVIAENGRKVGHVAASRAALMAPLLDELDADAYLVSGTAASAQSTALRVDLPRIPELRAYVKAQK